ncbi:hypothetical protein ILYODFUR_022393 [Ilyodon furcidens]|uniref:Uncharacterized protein n=1 Tax=Ilyodon furcidens TaxID=33524 RepID=A0ABV0TKY5_9TELE
MKIRLLLPLSFCYYKQSPRGNCNCNRSRKESSTEMQLNEISFQSYPLYAGKHLHETLGKSAAVSHPLLFVSLC